MFVLCPHCQFLITLDPASGRPPLRCPRCDEWLQVPAEESAPVNALSSTHAPTPEPAEPVAAPATLVEPDSEETAPTEPQDNVACAPSIEQVGPDSTPAVASAAATPESNVEDETTVAEATPLVETPSAARKRAPSFVRAEATDAASGVVRGRWLMPASIFGLASLLLLQMVLADRAQLATDARWRPALSTLCGVLRCNVPSWREPGAFTLLDRGVRPHPHVAGVLRVTASFRNDARWPQPWPSLLLTLSDVDGRVAGTRLFVPREYLGAASTQNGLASGQSASIMMDVREPAPRVVAFTFDFR